MIQQTNIVADQQESNPECVVAAVREGILHLHETLELARDAQRDEWEFALEITSLQQLGVHTSQLRWLVCKDYVEHRRETTGTGASERTFEPTGPLSFTLESCFMLTSLGEELACRLHLGADGVTRTAARDDQLTPVWDTDRRELRYRSQVVKRYKVPSPNQQMVLAAFDEEGWPCRIDDPLPPHEEIDPKRRLHDTIKSLNRHQLFQALRFRGDGTGEGVRWGPYDQA